MPAMMITFRTKNDIPENVEYACGDAIKKTLKEHGIEIDDESEPTKPVDVLKKWDLVEMAVYSGFVIPVIIAFVLLGISFFSGNQQLIFWSIASFCIGIAWVGGSFSTRQAMIRWMRKTGYVKVEGKPGDEIITFLRGKKIG